MKQTLDSQSPRIALVSVGLGRVQRGFERVASDLFNILRNKLDITLYRSRGKNSEDEKVPPLLKTATSVARALPTGVIADDTEYKRDSIAFALCLLPQLMRNRFDVIHCIDPPMATIFPYLRRVFRFPSRILFTEASLMAPEYYPPVDHLHQVAREPFQEALAAGVPQSWMTMAPLGVFTERFIVSTSRQELRERHGVSNSTFVVLVVSAINRGHKRIDHIIEEVSRVSGDVLLWIDGNPEDPSLLELARLKLGGKCRITHVSSGDVAELYGLADVMVHGSLRESFGLVVIEALSSGIEVLAHDSPHFAWLIHDEDCLLDMQEPGRLTARLQEMSLEGADRSISRQARVESVRERFDWRSLIPEYIDMYRQVATGPSGGNHRPSGSNS